jgi:uncharacterized protein YigE (DUF2233 family)
MTVPGISAWTGRGSTSISTTIIPTMRGHRFVLGSSLLRVRRFSVAVLMVMGCLGSARAQEPSWRALEPGLAYRRLDVDGARYHAVRVDLATHELRVADARREARTTATVDVLADEANALVALNGTFFDEKERPLGLVVSEGRELNPLREVSWWAALVVRDEATGLAAAVLTTEQIKALAPPERSALRFALQVGPRTVSAGRPLKLKPQSAARSAACVLEPQRVVLLATEAAPVESNDLAAVMSAPAGDRGFGCAAGLMFDGGSSTQLRISTRTLTLSVKGGWGVPNALVVVRRPGS